MSFIECNCNGDGSLDGKCDDAGKCSCKPGFDEVKCNTCAKNFFGFPQCQSILFFNFSEIMLFSLYYLMSFIECNCDGDGSLYGKCDDTGKCSCKTGFDGNKCDKCAKDFFGFRPCQSILFFNFYRK